MGRPVRVLVVGGGYVGLYAALRLQRRLPARTATITVVGPQPYMTYQPFLPEAAAGNLEPRHVVVPLRRVLSRCEVVSGSVTAVDHGRRSAIVQPLEGGPQERGYDELVMAVGSVARTLPIPGLATHGIGFKTVGEAIWLRNHVLSRLDIAGSSTDEVRRRRALSFVFVGGGYAGIEAFAELEDMARAALRWYRQIRPAELRWVLVEASDRILPEVSRALSAYTAVQLGRRGMELRLNTRLESCVDGRIVLSDGTTFDADTLVWTAGVRPAPLLAQTDLPLDRAGRLVCEPDLRVRGVDSVWAAGDCAAVPDLSSADPQATCAPSAQHAVRQARQLADNLAAALAGRPTRPYRHAYAGSVASLGLRKGVAEVYGIRLRGYPAWFMHRTYHLSRVPTWNRKARVMLDWTLALFFRREIVSLGELSTPREAFRRAAATAAPPGGDRPR